MANEYNITRLLDNIKVLPTLPADISKLPNLSELESVVLPPLPPYPNANEPGITKAGNYSDNYRDDIAQTFTDYLGNVKDYSAEGDTKYFTQFATRQVVPLRIKLQSEGQEKFWLFPIEPMISVESKNIIAKRNVAKKRDGGGSVKEYWTQDDWQININGLLSNAQGLEWPLKDIKKLVDYCTAKEPLDILCEPLLELGITHLVIEDYALPFTKGSENQNYTIKAVSDKSWNLFIKR